MLENIICIEGITCARSPAMEAYRRVPVDIEVAIGKRRSAIPHYWEFEALARRGC